MYFPSEKDWTYRIIFWTIILIFIITPLFSPGFTSVTLPTWETIFQFSHILPFAVVGFLLWIWFGTGYLIKEDNILISNGPFRKKIAIATITKIHVARNPLAGPTLALDKIEVHYEKYDSIVLSPKNRQLFMEQLLALNPNIHIES